MNHNLHFSAIYSQMAEKWKSTEPSQEWPANQNYPKSAATTHPRDPKRPYKEIHLFVMLPKFFHNTVKELLPRLKLTLLQLLLLRAVQPVIRLRDNHSFTQGHIVLEFYPLIINSLIWKIMKKIYCKCLGRVCPLCIVNRSYKYRK